MTRWRGLRETLRRQVLGVVRNPDIQMIRDLIYLGLGQVGVKLVGFVIYAYLARTLSTADYGALEAVLAVVGLLMIMVDFGLGAAGVRYRAQHAGKPEAEEVIGVVVALRLILSVICGTGLVIGVAVVLPGREMLMLASFLAVSLVLQSFGQEWLLQSLERMRDVALAQFLRTAVLAVTVLLMIRDTSQTAFFGLAEVVSVAVAMTFMWYAARRAGARLRLSLRPGVVRPMLRLAAPLGTNALMWGAAQFLPVVIVSSFGGLEAAAYFAAGQRLVVSLQALSNIYHFNMYPALTRRYFEGVGALVMLSLASLRIVAWACVGPAIFVSAHAGAVMAAIYGEAFRAAGPVMAVLIFAIPVQILSGHHRWALTAAGLNGRVLASGVAGLTVSVLGCLTLTPAFGAVGAAFGVVLATAAIWIVAMLFCTRAGFRIPILGRLARPILAGAAATFLSGLVPYGAASELITFVTIYVAIGLIVDQRRIYADLIHLAYSKKSRQADVSMID